MRLNHEAQAHRLSFYRPVDTKDFSFATEATKEEFLSSSVSWTCCAKKSSTSLSERSQKIWLDVYLRNICLIVLRPCSRKVSTFNIRSQVSLSVHPSGISRRGRLRYSRCRFIRRQR